MEPIENIKEVVKLLNETQNQSQVGRLCGKTKQWVSWYIRQHGIKKKVKRKENFYYTLKQKAIRTIWEYYLT